MPGEPFCFGFIGRHVAAKGIDQLVQAFRGVKGNAQLRIWGRPEGQLTAALHALADGDERIQWRPEYRNESIAAEVLSQCDAVVVPSIWCVTSSQYPPQPLHLLIAALFVFAQGRELAACHPRGAAGARAGHHCRGGRHGRVRQARLLLLLPAAARGCCAASG